MALIGLLGQAALGLMGRTALGLKGPALDTTVDQTSFGKARTVQLMRAEANIYTKVCTCTKKINSFRDHSHVTQANFQ